MSRYARENPDTETSHDWLAGAVRAAIEPQKQMATKCPKCGCECEPYREGPRMWMQCQACWWTFTPSRLSL